MTPRVARLSLMTLLLFGLLVSSELVTAPEAFAQIGKVQMGVNGMI